MSRSAVIAVFATICGVSAAGAPCDSLRSLKLSATTITAARDVEPGAFLPPGLRAEDRAAAPYKNLPAFCRVEGVIAPTPDSHIEFEVWLPEGWNGKYMGIGNGGFAGSITYAQMADALRAGYATSSTDTGHKAETPSDGSWSQGHPEKLIDYGYRAIHETALKSKEIVRGFYGRNASKSYFSSCSNGGRQALMEAQRYPADYDGIIAGAPAYNMTRTGVLFAWNVKALDDAASYIPAAKLPAIEAAVLKTCDALDGVTDGLLNDPRQCRFDPGSMVCQGAESNACLTAAQAVALKKIYGGPADSKGEPLYFGFPPGNETGWRTWITGPEPQKSAEYAFVTGGMDDFPNYKTYDFDRDTKRMDDTNGPILNAENPDLRSFQKRGGKLIVYHGWGDPALPATGTISYYEDVARKMGKDAASFVRLYMVPGMLHCAGGPGPNFFSALPSNETDPRRSMVRALEEWAEKNTAPAEIVATKFRVDGDRSSGVVRTRPLCPYPQVAKYRGSGSADDAANFSCAAN